jgi:hypothetical protein
MTAEFVVARFARTGHRPAAEPGGWDVFLVGGWRVADGTTFEIAGPDFSVDAG